MYCIILFIPRQQRGVVAEIGTQQPPNPHSWGVLVKHTHQPHASPVHPTHDGARQNRCTEVFPLYGDNKGESSPKSAQSITTNEQTLEE